MKICTGCKIEKPVDEFSKDKHSKDGLQYKCKECNKLFKKRYRQDNKEIINEHRKIWNLLNKERIQKYKTEWREKNRERIRYCEKIKRSSDPIYKLKGNLSSRTWSALKKKRWSKNSKIQQTLGADYKTVLYHIESRFKNGMSWDNYGEWHIDHIIPLSSAKTEEELVKICHYTNLQPLWAEENRKKGSKIIDCKL